MLSLIRFFQKLAVTRTIKSSVIKDLERWMRNSFGKQRWIPERRILLKVTIDDNEKASIDQVFNTLMGDKVEPRREFIETHAKYVRNLDI